MIFSSDYLGNITTFEEFPNIKCRILKYADPDHVYTWHTMPKTFSVSLYYSNGVIMSSMASQIITSVSSICSTVGSGTDKKTSKLHVTGLCAGNSPVTSEFPAQKASNPENVSIWWRHDAAWTTGICLPFGLNKATDSDLRKTVKIATCHNCP